MTVCIISGDRVFARMIELELIARGHSLSERAEIAIIDADTHPEATSDKAIYFGRGAISPKGEGSAFLRRPFALRELFLLLDSYSDTEKNEQIAKKDQNIEDNVRLTADGTLFVNGKKTPLSRSELEVLTILLKNRGNAVSKEQIIASVFPESAKNSNVCEVYIHYLRTKIDNEIGRPFIRTARGWGYIIK